MRSSTGYAKIGKGLVTTDQSLGSIAPTQPSEVSNQDELTSPSTLNSGTFQVVAYSLLFLNEYVLYVLACRKFSENERGGRVQAKSTSSSKLLNV